MIYYRCNYRETIIRRCFMNKKNFIIIGLGIIFGLVFIPFVSNFFTLISLPLKTCLDRIANLSLKSGIFNILSWILLVIISFLPFLFFISKYKTRDLKLLVYFLFSIIFLLLSISVLNPKAHLNIIQEYKILALSIFYYSIFIGIYFEVYFIKDSHLHTLLNLLTLCSIFAYASLLGFKIFILFNTNLESIFNIFYPLSTILIILVNLHLLINLRMFITTRTYESLKEDALESLINLKKLAMRVLAITIYTLIASTLVSFITLSTSGDAHVSFNIPSSMILITVFINIYVKTLIQAISVKKENEQFI